MLKVLDQFIQMAKPGVLRLTRERIIGEESRFF